MMTASRQSLEKMMKNAIAVCRSSSLALALAGSLISMHADATSLAPALAGQFMPGSGVDGQFLKVPDSWKQSTVLYDPITDQLGTGVPISNFPGGTGLWGLPDWHTAFYAPTTGMIEAQWASRVPEIAFGDQLYLDLYGAKWGTVALAPLFGPGSSASSQDNWASRFSGYIRIAQAGTYNFGVLREDGFFFKLGGAGGQVVSIESDFLNPPDRIGFNDALELSPGLYSFELGAYERLEVGVVELSWSRDNGDWSRLPTSHLVAVSDVMPVPEPGTWVMLLTGMAVVLTLASRRRPV